MIYQAGYFDDRNLGQAVPNQDAGDAAMLKRYNRFSLSKKVKLMGKYILEPTKRKAGENGRDTNRCFTHRSNIVEWIHPVRPMSAQPDDGENPIFEE